MSDRRERWSRRAFVGGLTLTGAASLVGMRAEHAAAEPPPETTTLRLVQSVSLCQAPQFLAGELLRSEGFLQVSYVRSEAGSHRELAAGQADITLVFLGPLILRVDTGDPVVMLAGGHVGCFELFGTDRVLSIRDLKGKSVAVRALGSTEHVFVSSMAAYVGLDPRRDIIWVTAQPADSIRLFTEGKIDAFMAFPPSAQELRARKMGHVVVNSATDRPWSQYFCCMIAGNREFVRKHPVATKRAVRAILKAADLCALEPDKVSRELLNKGFATNYDFARQTMRELPYGRWREYDPEDTVRFYALRLHEAGMIKSSPQKIIAQGTDWRFLNELKKELKG